MEYLRNVVNDDYFVSNKGCVLVKKRFVSVTKKNGKVFKRCLPSRFLKMFTHNKGYLYCNILGKKYYIHRLVARAFIMRPNGCNEVNHKNGIKTDNRVENLEWVTHRENMLHGYRTGLMNQKGVMHSQSKLSNENVIKIKEMIVEGVCHEKIAKRFSINKSYVNEIKRGRKWGHINVIL